MNLFPVKYLAGFCLLFALIGANAQPGCPNVSAGADVALPCGTNCTTLNATAFQTGATTTYSVNSIPYTPFSYTAGTPIIVNTDDVWSPVIPLPFTFCFFGQAYNNVVVGANGLISFDISVAGGYCDYDLTLSGTLPTTNVYGNTIMGPYHDIDPGLGGSVRYQIIGTAPCRIFVVSYNQVPLYDSDDLTSTCYNMDATHQIAIYETTNAIEVYIAHKTSCPDGGFLQFGWNDGLAVEGIQNATQTVAYTVPGRNNSVWNATNDAYRFTPNGPSIVTIGWLQGGNPIGVGPSVQVCPSSNTTYTAVATYTPCSGGTPVVVTDDVNVSLAGTLNASITSSQNISCNGGNDGSATATVSGGTGTVSYGWSNGSSNLTISGLSAGTYIFTATDAANCTRRDTVVITNPPVLTANVPNVNQTNCSGSGTGTLVATAAGGTPGYTFAWSSTAQTDSILDGVAAGSYTITVTDSKGCTASDNGSLTITTGGNNVTLSSPTITNVSCFGDSNGGVSITASGGSGTFTYTWSNSQTGNAISGVAAGPYTVSVDDGAGCTVSATYNVGQPTQLTLNAPNIQNIGCGGSSGGSITANPTGGTTTTGYTYSWVQQGNSQTYNTQTISGVSADTYNLTVTDANSCSVTASYAVTQVANMVFTQSQTDVSCNGGTNGTATIDITSGTQPFQFNWNNTGNSSNSTLTGLGAGPVTVSFSDANCSATASFFITEPSAIVISVVSNADVTCAGNNDGTITVDANGGTVGNGYTYNWSNGQSGITASGLAPGPHTVSVTDGNNCLVTATYTVTEPALIALNTTVTDAVCYQAPTGRIDLSVTGGTPPYTYLWSDGKTTQNGTGFVAGNYFVTVTDANSCTAATAGTIAEPAEMTVNISVTPVKCIGEENGTLTAVVNGGTSPYSYSVTQDGANFIFTTDGIVVGLAVGDYVVIISDNRGCTKTEMANIPDATPDDFITTTDSTSCYGTDYTDGRAHIVATSIWNGPYSFGIDGGLSQLSGDFYNLEAGEHIITAVSANNCTTEIPVVVYQPLPILVSVEPDSLILPLGEGATVLATYLNASNVNYLWEPSTGLSCIDCPNPFVMAYRRTDYVVTVSQQNGTSTCFGTATLHVNVLPHKDVYIPNTFTPNGDGNNDVFLIFGEDIRTVDLTIFNKWGELIYKSNNAFEGWDGTYKGQLQVPQVFVYYANITFLDDKTVERKGTITLLR